MSHTSSSSAPKPIIAVCGATGFQGGSVVRHLLRDGKFAVRALTRKPDSERAKGIASLGADVVQADFGDPPSLRRAFKGCYGVFGNTDYFEAFEKEAEHGINIVDAAKAEGIKHLILSTAPETRYNVPVLKHKATTATYLRQSGVPFTMFHTSFYYGGIFLFDALTRDHKTGGWRFNFPFPTDVPIPSVSPRDIGAYVLAGFANPSEWIGNEMKPVNEYITPRQYANTFADITGLPVEIEEVTVEDFSAMQHGTQVHDSWSVFMWHVDEYLNGTRSFSEELARRLCPDLQTFRDFATEYLQVPPEQRTTIQYIRTQEHFPENPVAS